MSLSPPTGTSSASWGSALYSQSFKACRASVNLPENSSASSNLCCLRGAKQYKHWINMEKLHLSLKGCITITVAVSYLSMDLPLTVSHVSLSSASRFSRCCLSWLVWALSWRLRPFFDVASYMGLFDLRSFWNS